MPLSQPFKCPCSQISLSLSLGEWNESNSFMLVSSAIQMLIMFKSVSPTQNVLLSVRKYRYPTSHTNATCSLELLFFNSHCPSKTCTHSCVLFSWWKYFLYQSPQDLHQVQWFSRTQRTQHIIILMVKMYYNNNNKITLQNQQREKVHEGKVQSKWGASKSPFPVAWPWTHLIPPAKSCNKIKYGLTRKLIRVSVPQVFYRGLVTQKSSSTNQNSTLPARRFSSIWTYCLYSLGTMSHTPFTESFASVCELFTGEVPIRQPSANFINRTF